MDYNKNLLIGICLIFLAMLFSIFALNKLNDPNKNNLSNNQEVTGDKNGSDDLVKSNETTDLSEVKLIKVNMKTPEQNDVDIPETMISFDDNLGKWLITIKTTASDSSPKPVTINNGMCPETENEFVKINPVINGESITELDMTLVELALQYPKSVVIYDSDDNAAIEYCGNISIN